MPFEKYFEWWLVSHSDIPVCLKLLLNFVLVGEKYISCNAQVSHTVMFGDVVCCLQGQSSFAELMNGNRKAKRRKQSGLTEIRSDMEEVSKGQKFVIFFLVPRQGKASDETLRWQVQDQQTQPFPQQLGCRKTCHGILWILCTHYMDSVATW